MMGTASTPGADAHDAFGVSGALAAPAEELSPGETPGSFNPTQPIKGRAIGVLASDKPGYSLFNEKLTQSDEFKFDGVKNGAAWKLRLTQHFIGRVPAMIEILKWSERHEQRKVTDDSFDSATMAFLDERQRGELQSQLWSFLAGCLVGSAKTMFNSVTSLNGLDAWRRAGGTPP